MSFFFLFLKWKLDHDWATTIDKLELFDEIRQNTERWMAKGIIVRNLDVTLMSEFATHALVTRPSAKQRMEM